MTLCSRLGNWLKVFQGTQLIHSRSAITYPNICQESLHLREDVLLQSLLDQLILVLCSRQWSGRNGFPGQRATSGSYDWDFLTRPCTASKSPIERANCTKQTCAKKLTWSTRHVRLTRFASVGLEHVTRIQQFRQGCKGLTRQSTSLRSPLELSIQLGCPMKDTRRVALTNFYPSNLFSNRCLTTRLLIYFPLNITPPEGNATWLFTTRPLRGIIGTPWGPTPLANPLH